MIVNRNNFFVEKCKGKKVFDVGCVCHDLSEDQIEKGVWLHHNIKQYAKSLKGVDIEKDEIKRLVKKGYNIEYCDAEKINENEKYDIVSMGSCIEHFYNPGLVLDRVRELCDENTEVILSTINAWGIRFFISAWRNDEARTCRDDHVSWYSHYVLENLLRMKGFKVTEKHYYNFYPEKMPGIRPFFRKLQKSLMPFTSHGIIVVFKKESN